MNFLALARVSACCYIIVKQLSTEKDCVIFLRRQKVAWALFFVKMADVYMLIGNDF